VAAKVADTLTSDPPLVGGWTSLGRFDDEPLHHAGPLGIWVLAVPTRILGDPGAGLVVGAALISMASLGLVAACVRRWGEPHLEVLFLGFTALMVASLGGDRLIDPNAPQIGVMPLLVVLVATVGVLAGHDRQLWALVAAGSLASQTHLGYLPLIGVMVVLVGAWLLVDTRRHPAARPRRWTRDVPVAVAIGLLAWVGPIVDQVAGSRNLTRLVAERIGSDDPTQGFGEAFRLLVAYTTVPAHWMGERAQNVPLGDPSAFEVIVSLIVLAVAVAGFVDAVRRRDRVRRSLGAVALVAIPIAIIR
jgi:cytochrome bd-type quinol oxidase subunit 2